MKNKIISLLLASLLLLSTVQAANAETLFLTSDNLIDTETDTSILNSIASYIEEISNGNIQVTVDSQAPGPGEGSRAIESNTDVSVTLAAACSGNFLSLADYSQNSNKQLIFVNTGNFDLSSEDSLRRAWDDNYSPTNFAGLNNPGNFLNDAGIGYIQPLQQYPNAGPDGYLASNDDTVNRYIAQEIVNYVNSYDSSSNKSLNENLVIRHSLDPSEMAQASSEFVNIRDINGTYNSYSTPQLLYLISSYLNGNGLENPGDYEAPTSPRNSSSFAQNTYSIYDYMAMGGIVKDYMDQNNRAPDYIEYNGAQIGYYDLLYNFALITQDHTNGQNMDFEREYTFESAGDSTIATLIPLLLALIAVAVVIVLARRRFRR